MKAIFLSVVAAVLLSLLNPPFAVGQSGSMSPMNAPSNGTITVYIRNQFGEPLSIYPDITLTSVGMGGSPAAPPQTTGDGWVFSGLALGQEYRVTVKADGYQTAYESAMLPFLDGASEHVIVFMTPIGQKKGFQSTTGQMILAPRAAKEVEHGLKDLRSRKFASAQKHLEKALGMAPGNPYVNYVMGMVFLVAKQAAKAKPFLEKSVSIDPKEPPSLLALGTVRLELGDDGGAIEVLTQDVKLDASSWKAEWMLSNAFLRQGNYAKAREFAEQALRNGKQNATQVALLLGQALAGLGEREKAIETFEAYLNAHPKDPNAEKIRRYVETLKRPPPAVVPVATSDNAKSAENGEKDPGSLAAARVAVPPPGPPVELPPKENWAPPDVDAAQPFVIAGATCPLPKILDAASKNAVEFVTTLQQFSATEEYQSVEIRRDEQLETPETRKYNYLVILDKPRPNVIDLSEERNQGVAPRDLPGRLVDMGAPGLALAFHPIYRDDFEWKCEGLGEWNDQPAWVVHFQQRTDRPISLLDAFDTPSQEFALPLKGRAWITQNGDHVVHLETDLSHPIEAIDLKRQHFAIDYRPVSFRKHNVELWLPQNVDAYMQYQGHFVHNYHHFSNFELFWVGTTQKISKPKQTDPQR